MKKLLLFILLIACSMAVYSQQDSTLQQYTGKYKFPSGSVVDEVTITLTDGILSATSTMGTTELKKIAEDEFEIVAYGGVATFKRLEGKINRIHIVVGSTILEGTKEE